MKEKLKTEHLRVDGMVCANCQNRIERKLRATAGVLRADVSYGAGTATVTYDEDIISPRDIGAVIEKLGYGVSGGQESMPGARKIAGLLLIVVTLFLLLRQFGILNMLVPGQLAETGMGYAMLFVIGVFTSIHCVAMCGGINISQCVPRVGAKGVLQRGISVVRPPLLYNFGRVGAYTATGFAVGALGSAVTFSPALQGVLKLTAGMIMVVMGINMLGIFPQLRRLISKMPKIFSPKRTPGKSNSPLIVGLLNGLMPCGPLQAMQIYALSTGNPFTGAASMFLFGLGTVPLMFGLGALSSALGGRFSRRAATVGAILVVALGMSMFAQGWNLSGLGIPSQAALDVATFDAGDAASAGTNLDEDAGGADILANEQIVNSVLASGRYPDITVQAGTSVRWVIDAPQGSVNGCNNRMYIQEYGIEHQFETGENIIEFVPDKTGTFRYSCWMGMISGTITVV